ncbi:hypothetical protein [Bradyrhizobium sp. CCBAU 51627]|uniref:hypothetical protein n=1 Tax=Bradyrhizobium sp. CCBAU 51627 TaxID=1325088 RepID=UPI00230548B5|nr:hypothetical protein [Bradyrhizobium sp. CCBAU 51627]
MRADSSGSAVRRASVIIPTLAAPVRIISLLEEDAGVEESTVCLNKGIDEAVIAASYNNFVKRPTGVIHRLFGKPPFRAFRLDVSDRVEVGSSWQLAVLIAHALRAAEANSSESRLDVNDKASSELVWATGAISPIDFAVLPVAHISEKLRASRSLFEDAIRAGRRVHIFIPQGDELDVNPDVASWIAARGLEIRKVKFADEIFELLELPAIPRTASHPGANTWTGNPYIGAQIPWQILVAGFNVDVLTYSQTRHWLEFADTIPRCRALAALAHKLRGAEQAKVLADVVSAIPACAAVDRHAIENWHAAETFAETIATVVPHLSEQLKDEALSKVSKIDDRYVRSLATAALVPCLPVNQQAPFVKEVLAIARSLDRSLERSRVVSAIAPHLISQGREADLLAEVVAAARSINSDSHAEVCAGLVSCCSQSRRDELLSSIFAFIRILPEGLLASATLALTPHMPSELLPEVLSLVQGFEDEFDRIRCLVALAKYMSQRERRKVLDEAVATVRQWEYAYPRVLCLANISQYLDGDDGRQLLEEARADVNTISWGDDRADAYAVLATHFQGKERSDLLSEALAQGRDTGWDIHRYEALAALAPHLDAQLLLQALSQACAIDDDSTSHRLSH